MKTLQTNFMDQQTLIKELFHELFHLQFELERLAEDRVDDPVKLNESLRIVDELMQFLFDCYRI